MRVDALTRALQDAGQLSASLIQQSLELARSLEDARSQLVDFNGHQETFAVIERERPWPRNSMDDPSPCDGMDEQKPLCEGMDEERAFIGRPKPDEEDGSHNTPSVIDALPTTANSDTSTSASVRTYALAAVKKVRQRIGFKNNLSAPDEEGTMHSASEPPVAQRPESPRRLSSCSSIGPRGHTFVSHALLRMSGDDDDDLGAYAAAAAKATGGQFLQRMLRLQDLEEPLRNGLLHTLTDSKIFTSLCTVIIALNAMVASIAVNYEIQNIENTELQWLIYAEIFFMLFYTTELVLKLLVHRCYYFVNDDAAWNNFDMLLVLLGIYDFLLRALQLESGTNLTFARLCRLLKLSRLLRVLRAIRFVSPLRKMLHCIAQSLSMLFWAIVVLVLLWWTLALVLLQGLAQVLQTEAVTDDLRARILDRFGSVPRAILTLLSMSTGGEDWEDSYHVVRSAGDFYAFILLLYLCFFTISLISVLTGIVVEHVVSTSWLDDNDRVMHFRNKKLSQAKALQHLFSVMDVDMSGEISQAEFEIAMRDHRVLAMMEENGVEPRDARMFYKLLKQTSDGCGVDASRFIDSFMQMHGTAAAIDVQILLHQADVLLKQVRNQRKDLCEVKAMIAKSGRSSAESYQRRCVDIGQGHVTFEDNIMAKHQEARAIPNTRLFGLPASSEKAI